MASQAKNIFRFVNYTLSRVNSHFVLSFEKEASRIGNTRYDLPAVVIEDYNTTIDARYIFFNQLK